jgi:ABC-type antimicrobial peptide transport system ATPase subunit
MRNLSVFIELAATNWFQRWQLIGSNRARQFIGAIFSETRSFQPRDRMPQILNRSLSLMLSMQNDLSNNKVRNTSVPIILDGSKFR